jgi:hypothetical protein
VLHTAEGALSIESLGSFFQSPNAGVSSHVGIDDKEATVGEFVYPDWKAWTAADFNPVGIQAELCGFASWTYAEWTQRHGNMLANCAAWVAEECARYGLPIKRLSAAEAQGSGRGVCQHIDLGADGGGHVDCDYGTGNFPMDDVLEMAAGGAPNVGAPQTGGRNMIAAAGDGKGYWTVTRDGAVGAHGSAQYKGGGFSPDLIAGECVGIAGNGTNDGYWLYASDGGVFAFGSADYYGRSDRY